MIEKNNIIFFSPSINVKKIFFNKKNIIFLKENYFDYFDLKTNKRKKISLNSINIEIENTKLDINSIITEIRSWGPVWSRWNDQGDQFERYYRQSLLNILRYYNYLNKLNIKKVFFFTSSSHHIDSLELELSLRLAKIDQIYFGYDDWTGYLIPSIYRKSHTNKKIINTGLTHSFLNKILKNTKKNKFSQKLNIFENKKSNSYYFALYQVLRRFASDIIKKIFISKKINYHHSIFSTSTLLKLIKIQKEAITFYKQNTIDKKEFYEILKKKNCLVYVAHNEPEASMYPEGGEFNNVIDIILNIKKKFNVDIFYKEHPITTQYHADYIHFTRVGVARSKKYYSELLDLGCKFIDYSIYLNDNKIIGNILPVTVTGSIAVERAVKGYETIVCGYPWYKNIPGVIKFNKIKNLNKIINQKIRMNKDIKKRSIIFLDKIYRNCTTPNFPGIGNPIPDLSSKSKNNFKKTVEYLIKNA